MGKKSKNNNNKEKIVKAKKVPDRTAQLVRKARRTYQSSGARGLFRFVHHYPEMERNRTVAALLVDAKSRPLKPKKGQRGPAPKVKVKTEDTKVKTAKASNTISADDEVWAS